MSTEDPQTLDQLRDLVGSDLVDHLAEVAQQRRVMIHLTVSPYDDHTGEVDDDQDNV